MRVIFNFYFFLLLISKVVAIEELDSAHAISMHGVPKYEKNFKNFDYVNPEAPKGGTIKQYEIGSFDTLNNFLTSSLSIQSYKKIFLYFFI